MPLHFKDFLAGGNHSPGVLLVPQNTTIGRVIVSLLVIWIASESEEWIHRIAWLSLKPPADVLRGQDLNGRPLGYDTSTAW